MNHLICATLLFTANFFPTFAYQLNYFYPNELRRQDLSYSTNIVHENSGVPDQMSAQSTVNVNFNPHSTSGPEAFPRRQTKQVSGGDTQLFNVGYSVSFKNAPGEGKQFKRQQNLNNGEIITGTRKRNEQVDAPNFDIESRQIQEPIDIVERKHKISGIKPKATPTPSSFLSSTTNQLVTSANLSPSTQKQLKVLENVQPQFKIPKQIHENYSWRSIGPNIEIVRSSEIPIGATKTSERGFNHEKALGRSESFDFSNALDNGGEVQAKNHNYEPERAEPVQIPIHPQSARQIQFEETQLPVKQYFGNGLKLVEGNGNVPVAKLPVDMSLVRDPIITTDLKHAPENPGVIPIHFDIRPIQDALKGQFNGPQQPVQYQRVVFNPQLAPQGMYQHQPSPVYLQQAYLPEKPIENPHHQPVNFKMYTKAQTQVKPVKAVYIKQYNTKEKYHRQPRNNMREELLTNLRPPRMNGPLHHQKIILNRSYF